MQKRCKGSFLLLLFLFLQGVGGCKSQPLSPNHCQNQCGGQKVNSKVTSWKLPTRRIYVKLCFTEFLFLSNTFLQGKLMTGLPLSLKSKKVAFAQQPLVECLAHNELSKCLLKLDKKKKKSIIGCLEESGEHLALSTFGSSLPKGGSSVE